MAKVIKVLVPIQIHVLLFPHLAHGFPDDALQLRVIDLFLKRGEHHLPIPMLFSFCKRQVVDVHQITQLGGPRCREEPLGFVASRLGTRASIIGIGTRCRQHHGAQCDLASA